MSRYVSLALLLMVLFFPAVAAAQQPEVLDRLEVDLPPEYDRPGVLVIYRLTLAPDEPMPVALVLRIPTAAGEPSAVAYRQSDLNLVTLPYQRRVDGDLARITFTAGAREVQFGYYDPALRVEGAAHSFAYVWPGDYGVHDLTLEVQEPAQASTLSITPPQG